MSFEHDYRVVKGKKFQLRDYPTAVAADPEKQDVKQQLAQNIETLTELQSKLYAQNRYGVIILFQAMDAAGKDSMIRHVMSGINPQGCQVTSFKQPSALELDHDYLWRIHQHVPERGMIGIFNRSYYEDVLISKVHPELILNSHIGAISRKEDVSPKFFKQRYEDIRYFEKYLTRNGFVVLKFFLNMSKQEQKKRFLRRIDLPTHNWKFSQADVQERQYWKDYQQAYEQAIAHTVTKKNPWYVIPSDDKWYSRLCVSDIIVHRLAELPLAYPEISDDQNKQLQQVKIQLEKS